MIYQGSKSRVAERIFSLLYQFACSDDCNVHFYDLFGGGGSMSQYALKYTKWHVHYNELRASTLNAFRQEITGDWQYRWVSREDFKKGKIYLFKFVINKESWLSPPKNVINTDKAEDNHLTFKID